MREDCIIPNFCKGWPEREVKYHARFPRKLTAESSDVVPMIQAFPEWPVIYWFLIHQTHSHSSSSPVNLWNRDVLTFFLRMFSPSPSHFFQPYKCLKAQPQSHLHREAHSSPFFFKTPISKGPVQTSEPGVEGPSWFGPCNTHISASLSLPCLLKIQKIFLLSAYLDLFLASFFSIVIRTEVL